MEQEHLHLNAVAGALESIRRKLAEPGRWLRFSERDYYNGVFDARDRLDEALIRLPAGARADLGRVVARLDAEFERRTVPDERSSTDPLLDGWWARNMER
ncbi:hypothetical protein [Yinghuangia sp. YIM S10712]|uniref:hypothetical protein n=1 Tax=Yinghuangia sp. YIM S10712 TaxID=3436930 RepID=UPI003F53417F